MSFRTIDLIFVEMFWLSIMDFISNKLIVKHETDTSIKSSRNNLRKFAFQIVSLLFLLYLMQKRSATMDSISITPIISVR